MKNKTAILQLFAANTISGFAQGISMLAIPWYFTGIIKEPSLFGVIYFTVTVIALFWGLFAGTLVDKYNRKHLFLAETSLGTVLLLGIATYGYTVGSVPTSLVGLVFAITFWCYNLHYPALYAFVQEISEPKDYKRLTSWLEIQGQMTGAIAGGMGAVLLSGVAAGDNEFLGMNIHMPFAIEQWSIQKVFLLDGMTYLLSFLIILPLKYKSVAIRTKETMALRERLTVGVNFLKANPALFIFISAASFVFVTTMVNNYVLMPNYVSNYLHSGANVYAIGDMAFAFGAIASGFLIIQIFKKYSLVLGCIFMSLITTSAFFVLSFDRHILVYYLLLFCFGIANSGSRILRVSYIFKHVPNQVIGRVQSIFMIVNVLFRLFFIGLFALPFFVQNIAYAYGIFSFCCLFSSLVMAWFYKRLINN